MENKTDIKQYFINQFDEFEKSLNGERSSDFHKVRKDAISKFADLTFPTQKDEEWKYTSLNTLLKNDYSVFPDTENVLELKDVRQYFLDEIDTYRIVFVDGLYSPFLSHTSHEQGDICLLSSALKQPKYQMIINHYFGKIASNDESLTCLNTAFAREGAFIRIPKNTIVERPVQILYFSTGNEKELILQPRNLVIVDENSHVQIIERHQSLTTNKVLTNAVTEIFANKRAIVDYYKLQNDNLSASLIDNTFVQQKDSSIATVNTFSF